jgi:hypothetical protein
MGRKRRTALESHANRVLCLQSTEDQLSKMEEHLKHAQKLGADVDLDLAKISGMRRTLRNLGLAVKRGGEGIWGGRQGVAVRGGLLAEHLMRAAVLGSEDNSARGRVPAKRSRGSQRRTVREAFRVLPGCAYSRWEALEWQGVP